MAFDPQIANEQLKSWGAQVENEGRTKERNYQKKGRYLVDHKAKQPVLLSINGVAAPIQRWGDLSTDYRVTISEPGGSEKAVVRQYPGKTWVPIIACHYTNAHDTKRLVDWYAG